MKMNDKGKYKVTEKEWFIVIVSTIKIWNIQWTFIFIYHFQDFLDSVMNLCTINHHLLCLSPNIRPYRAESGSPRQLFFELMTNFFGANPDPPPPHFTPQLPA